MITYGMVVAACIIMQVLVGTGHISSPMEGLLVPFCIYVIMAASLNLAVGILGGLGLGHAGSMCVGVFAGALFSRCMKGAVDPTLGMVTAILIGAVTAALFGTIIGIPVLRLRGDYLVIVTLAFDEIIKNLANAIYLGRDTAGFHISLKDSVSLKTEESEEILIKGVQGITGAPQIAAFTIGVILVLVTLFIAMDLVDSRTDRAIMAIRDNRIAAKSIGINITKYKLLAFSIPAGLADTAGTSYAHNLTALTALSKNLGYNMSIIVLIYVVLNGTGNIHSSVTVMVTLYLLPEMLHELSSYHMLIYAIMLILAMLFNSASQFVALCKRVAEKFSRKDRRPTKGAA